MVTNATVRRVIVSRLVPAIAVAALALPAASVNAAARPTAPPPGTTRPAAAPAGSPGSCRSLRVPVALRPGRPRDQAVAGTLCVPAGAGAGDPRQVDVLVHGGSYSSAYWDWPLLPGRYSYVRQRLAAGRATLAYDRLGVGASSRPPGAAASVEADAFALHQLIAWLRSPDPARRPEAPRGFGEVNVVAHSAGTTVAINEAATHDDPDRLVVTGFVHPPGTGVGLPLLAASLYPALLDRRFAGRLLDPGYMTTRPGTRAGVFYDTRTADPQVIARDEATKALVPAAQVAGAAAKLALPPGLNDTSRVRVPVLLVLGEHDAIFCGLVLDCSSPAAVRANEAPYFGAAASLDAQTIPGTGHSLTLHPSAYQSFRGIDRWIRTH